MSSPPDPAGLQDADFETIEAAVNETARGRWFLAEYGRRTRAAETERLLAAMGRIERAVEESRHAAPFDVLRFQSVAAELAQRLDEVARCLGGDQPSRPPAFGPSGSSQHVHSIESQSFEARSFEAQSRIEEEQRLIEQRLIEPPYRSSAGDAPARDAHRGRLSDRLDSMRTFDASTDSAPHAGLREGPTLADVEAMPLRDRLRSFG